MVLLFYFYVFDFGSFFFVFSLYFKFIVSLLVPESKERVQFARPKRSETLLDCNHLIAAYCQRRILCVFCCILSCVLQTFHATKVSIRLTLFHVYFLRTFRPRGFDNK